MDDMVTLPGGAFRMGSDFYPEEGPIHEEWVAPFELDRSAVTNARFAEFVASTSYITVAERELDPAMFPGATLDSLAPGSLVFTPTAGPVDLRDWRQWWAWTPGANWRHPVGPESTLDGKDKHPVVQLAFEDATAFATWDGKRLPTEVEWEYAARGGLDQAIYAWGDQPNDGQLANSWQGRFPYLNTGAGSGTWIGTAPVGSFPPNAYGLDLLDRPTRRPSHQLPMQPRHRTHQQHHPRRRDTPPRPQRRLPPLRTRILPPLPTRSTLSTNPRLRNHTHQPPLRTIFQVTDATSSLLRSAPTPR
jgi:hypothetical protein